MSETTRKWKQTKAKQFPEPGWVYIIRIVEHDGPVKIGRTVRAPFNRVRGIDHFIPFETESIAFKFVDDAPLLESILHAEYEHLRIKGEWFRLENEHLERIISEYGFFDEAKAKELDAEHMKEWREDWKREKREAGLRTR